MARSKVTTESAEALLNKEEESIQNTEVVREGDYYVMRLYDNPIARIHKDTDVVQITTQGYDTQLTTRRLNGLLEALQDNPEVKVRRSGSRVLLGDREWREHWTWSTVRTASGITVN